MKCFPPLGSRYATLFVAAVLSWPLMLEAAESDFVWIEGEDAVKKSVKPQVPTTEEIVDIIVPSISIDDLSEIVIRLGDGNSDTEDKPNIVHLAKEDDQWIVKTQYGIYANEKTITPLLEKLDQLEGELRPELLPLL